MPDPRDGPRPLQHPQLPEERAQGSRVLSTPPWKDWQGAPALPHGLGGLCFVLGQDGSPGDAGGCAVQRGPVGRAASARPAALHRAPAILTALPGGCWAAAGCVACGADLYLMVFFFLAAKFQH